MIPSALSPSLAVSTSYWLRSKALSANRMRGSSSTQSTHGRVTDISLAIKRPPDRKSTRLNPVTNAHLVCSLLLEQKKILVFNKHIYNTQKSVQINITLSI